METRDLGSRQPTGGKGDGAQAPTEAARGETSVSGAGALESVVNGYLLEQALIVDVQRVLERVEVRLAYLEQIGKLVGAPDLAQVFECLNGAVADQLEADYREVQRGHTEAEDGNERDLFLVTGLGVRPEHARSVAVAYNGLAPRTRRAFYAVAIHARPLAELMAEISTSEWKTPEGLRQDVVLALDTLMGVEAPKR